MSPFENWWRRSHGDVKFPLVSVWLVENKKERKEVSENWMFSIVWLKKKK